MKRRLIASTSIGLATAALLSRASHSQPSSPAFANISPHLAIIATADPTGATDCTTSLQASITAAAGGVCYIPPGAYLITAPLTVSSNTKIVGSGHPTRIFATNATPFNMINNTNLNATYNATTKVDTNIHIEGIFFDYGATNGGGAHAIAIRMAQNITVRDCYFNGGNDATAFIACTTTIVENCNAVGNTNCSYDHWEGAQDGVVRDCFASGTGSAYNAVLFTGVGNPGTVRTSDNFLLEGCTFSADGTTSVGVLFNSGGIGCFVTNCRVINNYFYNFQGGVVMSGSGGGHIISGNTFVSCGNSSTGNNLFRTSADPDAAGDAPPNNCMFMNNTAINCVTAGANVGLIQLQGFRHFFGSLNLAGCAISGGICFWVTTSSSGCVIAGPISADAATISGVSFGIGNETNAQMCCWNDFDGYFRHAAGSEVFSQGLTISNNRGLATTNQTSSAAAAAGTLTNAPVAGNPGYWLKITINGTNYSIPCWAG